jgi:iduronate 2-sulfatase
MKSILFCLFIFSLSIYAEPVKPGKYNVLFIISDDLSSRALACYGNSQCKTPNIDKLAEQGTRFTNTYCQYPVCGASRASFMSGLYPHQTGVLGNGDAKNIDKKIGANFTMTQNFKEQGYYSVRVGKIYHMLIPGNITEGVSGPDHKDSWSEAFNFQGNEWFSEGEAEAIDNTKLNMDKTKHYALGFGGAFYSVKTPDEKKQPDYLAANKAIDIINNKSEKPFFLALGFIRPHVPLVAPKKYFDMYPTEKMIPAELIDEDLKDIPKAGIGKNSKGIGVEEKIKQQKILSAYYASVTFMDEQVGRVIDALEKKGLRENTIVIFTSDHGWHLGEHTFWQKMNLHEESAQVPMIISAPGQKPAICSSMTELLDLYPTLSKLCNLKTPSHVKGKDLTPILNDPKATVRKAAFCVMRKDYYMFRTDKWAFIQYGTKGQKGYELYNMKKDPKQYTNLAKKAEYKSILEQFKTQLAEKLKFSK